MNDRYLYRAKRIDNGEWVEGFLIFEKDRAFIAHRVCEVMNSYSKTGEEYGFGNFIEVYPSTICQCTGLRDEDGKKIFEGDIVGYIDCTSTENGYSEHYCRGRVVWDEETASFQVTERLSAESYEVLDRGCNVLGNIFDNPELLEVEE